MSRYDTIYLNINSKRIIDTKVILILGCQKREPDEISDMTYSYKGYILPINFAGWKEFKISFQWMILMGQIYQKLVDLKFTLIVWGKLLVKKLNYI